VLWGGALLFGTLEPDVSKIQNQKPEIFDCRGGDLGKSGPGTRAKADAKRGIITGSGAVLFIEGFTPQSSYSIYYKSDPPLACK
jgi:hypothetical protein